MKKMAIYYQHIILFTFLIHSFYAFNHTISMIHNLNNSNTKDFYNNIYKILSIYINDNSNYSIIYNDIQKNDKCRQQMAKFTKDQMIDTNFIITNLISSLVTYEGSEYDCLKSYNLTYLFITYNYNLLTRCNRDIWLFQEFLEKKDEFFTSLCLPQECYDFYNHFFDLNINENFFLKLKEDYEIDNVKLYEMNYLDNKSISFLDKKMLLNENRMMLFFTFKWILYIFILFCFICTFLDHILIDVETEGKIIEQTDTFYSYPIKLNEDIKNYDNIFWKKYIEKSKMMENFSSRNSEDLSSLNNTTSNNSYFLSFPITSHENVSEMDKLFEARKKNLKTNLRKGYLFKFIKLFSLKKRMKILFSSKSKYYNESNLEIFQGIKFYLLFFLTLNINIRNLETVFFRTSTRKLFYFSLSFFIVKFTSYVIISFIVVDGIELGFKLMSYFKKNKGIFNLKEVAFFIFKSIPRLFLFLLSFIFLIFIKEIHYLIFGNMAISDDFLNSHLYSKQCINQPYTVFIPFYLNLFFKENDYSNSNCMSYVYYLVSQFYCFIFLTFLFYFLNKIRSKRLDLFVYVLNFFSLLICHFYYNEIPEQNSGDGKYYTISRVMGETYSIQKSYLFIFPYFLGFNLGIMWFYYNDITSNLPLIIDFESYFPFMYNFYIMKYFDKKSNNFKIFILILTILLIILLSFSFHIITLIYTNYKNPLSANKILVEYDPYIRLFFIYEGKIFVILFLLMIMSILFYDGEIFLKNMLISKLFSPIDKIAFTYFCFKGVFVSIFYTAFKVNIYLTVNNSFLLTLGFFTINLIISSIIFMLFEVPFRIICKTFSNRTNLVENL